VDEHELTRILCSCGSCTWEDLLARLGEDVDRRRIRGLLADLIRRGVVWKEPDYGRGKLVYRARCG